MLIVMACFLSLGLSGVGEAFGAFPEAVLFAVGVYADATADEAVAAFGLRSLA
jgi:hypothetical protein